MSLSVYFQRCTTCNRWTILSITTVNRRTVVLVPGRTRSAQVNCTTSSCPPATWWWPSWSRSSWNPVNCPGQNHSYDEEWSSLLPTLIRGHHHRYNRPLGRRRPLHHLPLPKIIVILLDVYWLLYIIIILFIVLWFLIKLVN